MVEKTGEKTMKHELRAITNIKIYGLNFYYDKVEDKVGFPVFYNEDNSLDYRVGHQQWIDKQQAKAIVLRILEMNQNEKENEELLEKKQ